MNILIVGAGGVGSAVASIIETRSFYKKVILADFDASVAQAALDFKLYKWMRDPGQNYSA